MDFGQFTGLSGRGCPLPFLNSVVSCLCEQRMTAFDFNRLGGAVWCYHRF
jgi:hypothetical protein